MSKHIILHDYPVEQPGDLALVAGEAVWVTQKEESGWWKGENDKGETGVFPYNRVEEHSEADLWKLIPLEENPSEYSDRVRSLMVKPEEPYRNRDQKFRISLILASGDKVSGIRSFKQIRTLSRVFQRVSNCKDEITGIHPVLDRTVCLPTWADELRIPTEVGEKRMKERAQIIGEWMKRRLERYYSLHYVNVFWVDKTYPFEVSTELKALSVEALKQASEKSHGRPKTPKLCRFKHEWIKKEEKEIAALKGEIVAFSERSRYEGWYSGETMNGRRGIFPSNFINKLNLNEVQALLFAEKDKKPLPAAPQGLGSVLMAVTVVDREQRKLPPRPERPARPQQPERPERPQQPERPQRRPSRNRAPVAPEPFAQPTSGPRQRKREQRFGLCSREAFDQLRNDGVTVEENGKLALFSGQQVPKKGDQVSLNYSAFLWTPQKQELLEFASSDKLISDSTTDNSGKPLVFEVGAGEAIDAIEETVAQMSLGQRVRIIIHPRKGFGEEGLPPDIPGNAYLVYDISLSHIQPGRGLLIDEELKVALGGLNLTEDLKKKLSLHQLQLIIQKGASSQLGINLIKAEDYLTPDEFERALLDPLIWNLTPVAQREELKRNIGIM